MTFSTTFIIAAIVASAGAATIPETDHVARGLASPVHLDSRALNVIEDDAADDDDEVYAGAEACHTLVGSALAALANPAEPNLQYIFGDTSDATRTGVQTRLQQIDYICSENPQSPEITVYPNEDLYYQANPPPPGTTPVPRCNPAPLPGTPWGWSFIGGFVLCPVFYNYEPLPSDCWSVSQGGIIIHMLLHQPAVTNGAPGQFDDDDTFGMLVLVEPTEQRLDLPDSYQYYASNVFNACVDGGNPNPPTPDSSDGTASTCSDVSCGDMVVLPDGV